MLFSALTHFDLSSSCDCGPNLPGTLHSTISTAGVRETRRAEEKWQGGIVYEQQWVLTHYIIQHWLLTVSRLSPNHSKSYLLHLAAAHQRVGTYQQEENTAAAPPRVWACSSTTVQTVSGLGSNFRLFLAHRRGSRYLTRPRISTHARNGRSFSTLIVDRRPTRHGVLEPRWAGNPFSSSCLVDVSYDEEKR